MRLRLTTTALGYVIALPVLAVLSVAYSAWHTLDDAIGYREVPGTIVSVDDLCALDLATPVWRPCETADISYVSLGQGVRKVLVDVRYTSPVDNRSHDHIITMGHSEALRNRVSGDANIAGTVGPVMASIRKADIIHYDKWRFSRPDKSL
jgi:hypothetical protein